MLLPRFPLAPRAPTCVALQMSRTLAPEGPMTKPAASSVTRSSAPLGRKGGGGDGWMGGTRGRQFERVQVTGAGVHRRRGARNSRACEACSGSFPRPFHSRCKWCRAQCFCLVAQHGATQQKAHPEGLGTASSTACSTSSQPSPDWRRPAGVAAERGGRRGEGGVETPAAG